MHFGPLNRQGGERRRNVAVTRARRELVVFSSLLADQIDLSRTQSLGGRHLRAFLDYAQRGPRAIVEAVSLDPSLGNESPFERAVQRALERRGHVVYGQVGCSGYRIDLAVVDPRRPGRYLLRARAARPAHPAGVVDGLVARPGRRGRAAAASSV